MSTGIAIAPIFLLLIAGFVAVIAFIIYMALYKRNINKALQENNGKHVSLPDAPSVIAIILIVILFFNIFSLNTQLSELQHNMNSFRSNVEHNINNLENTISELHSIIEKSNSLISSYDYETFNFNTEELTVDLKFMLTLKNFTDKTTVSVGIGDNTVKLDKSSVGKYTGTMNISIFNNQTEVTAFISDGNTTQTEILEDIYVDYLWMEHLPSIDAKYDDVSLTYQEGKISFDDYLYIYLNNPDKHRFTDLYIEIFVDNKSAKKIDVGYSNLKEDYELKIKDSIDVYNEESMIDIYVIGTDSAGITHKCIAYSGNSYSIIGYADNEVLYDSNGTRLTNDLIE